MSPVLHLYGRRDCHLCAEMRDALESHPAALDVVEFDVDSDPAYARIYGARVPVLTTEDGTEICHYFLDIHALDALLETR